MHDENEIVEEVEIYVGLKKSDSRVSQSKFLLMPGLLAKNISGSVDRDQEISRLIFF